MDRLVAPGILLLTLVYWLLWLYSWILFVGAIISWMFLPPTNPVVRFLRFVTEPVLNPCRQLLFRILPSSWRRFDFSPILAILLVQLVMRLLQMFF